MDIITIFTCFMTVGIFQLFLHVRSNADSKWCSYQLHLSSLSWHGASLACQENGLKLAGVNNSEQHAYLTSLVMTSLIKLNPGVQMFESGLRMTVVLLNLMKIRLVISLHYATFIQDLTTARAISSQDDLCSKYNNLATSPLGVADKIFPALISLVDQRQTMWIGLRADDKGSVRYADCSPYSAEDYDPTQDIQNHNSCIVFDAAATVFTAEDCMVQKPFLCQHTSYDKDDCWYTHTAATGYFANQDQQLNRNTKEDCLAECGDVCVGFNYESDIRECSIMTYCNELKSYRPSKFQVKGYTTPRLKSTFRKFFGRQHDIVGVYEKSASAILNTENHENLATRIETTDQCSRTAEIRSNTDVTTGSSLSEITPHSILFTSYDVQRACSSHDSVSLESTCYCSCEEKNKPTETPEELKENMEKMNAKLLINKKDLSSWKRKLISAPDQRMSAKGIGLFGVGILISLGIALVILDLPALVGEHQRLMNRFKKCRNLKHRTVNKTHNRNGENV